MPDYFVVTAPGLEAITAAELQALGTSITGSEPGGVSFTGDAGALYRANLECRTASRITMRLGDFEARTWFELERHARKVPWERVLGAGAVPEFEVTSRKSKLYHQKGIAERLTAFAASSLTPPGDSSEVAGSGVDPQRFTVRAIRDRFTISADTSGELLHRRGYRLATAKAPMRETLAAAMLLASGWSGRDPLIDPFCGSGTIPIEAALLARRIAPGLARRFAFEWWPTFDPALWQRTVCEARDRILPSAPSPIIGSDRDAGAIDAAIANAERAGVTQDIQLRRAPLSALEPPDGAGLLLTNPPYGERVGGGDLRDLYAQLGNVARQQLPGWTVGLLAASPALVGQTRLEWHEQFRTSNGGIDVQFLTGTVAAFRPFPLSRFSSYYRPPMEQHRTAKAAGSLGLAERLRGATGAAHTAAERTSFVRHLFKGTLPKPGYVAFIRALHPVYAALEAGLGTNSGDPAVGMIYDPALSRTASLERDLTFFAGEKWRDMPVVGAAKEYAAHLAGLAKRAPKGLVAHAYVRYLGDLSGGQMMGKRVATSYEAGDAGTNFYAFKDVGDINARKHQYRAALTALPLSAAEQDLVVNEAIAGFDYARRIFEELDTQYPST